MYYMSFFANFFISTFPILKRIMLEYEINWVFAVESCFLATLPKARQLKGNIYDVILPLVPIFKIES